jgi:hypothetical protein
MRLKSTTESLRLHIGTFALLAAMITRSAAADTPPTSPASNAQDQSPAVVSDPFARTSIRYDAEYPAIGYADSPSHNAITRLQQRLNRGEVRLKFQPPRGYLDSVLSALGIDPSSQTLVYSKTSLQLTLIAADTPRAVYFDDDTYVAWIPGTKFLEIATMDGAVGPVFYTLSNVSPTEVHIDRETSRCLTCHDTWGMAGGGVPRFLFLSTLVDKDGEASTGQPGEDTTDHTPISARWAGWYVTGQHGTMEHLGNIFANSEAEATNLASLRHGNIDNVQGLFDARSYMTDKSDIVALLVFEHQAYVGNLITRANYKSRTLLRRNEVDASTATSWSTLPPTVQRSLKAMLEPLVQAMLFVDSAAITSAIHSSSGYDRWFQSKGPRDASGRSLRELDLRTHVFKHPLSYLVYSESFDGLPAAAKDYVYERFAGVLSGRDQSPQYAHISADERRILREILTSTKPDFGTVDKQEPANCGPAGCS